MKSTLWAADATYIQMKMLNSSRGPAVRALRAQSDKREYIYFMRNLIESEQNISIKQTMAVELIVENGEVRGIVDEYGLQYLAPSVILTTGTSLCGRIFVGLQSTPAGRMGERAAVGLSDSLKAHGIEIKKLKTGTPARVDARTIDYSKMDIQPGDEELNFFSFEPNRPVRKQYPCYLTRTTEKTHEIIKANLDKSPMYSGLIHGVGPRYCPSIEDKVVRFANNPSHHIFIEPEGKDTYEVYVQGFSTSLPAPVQVEMLHSLPGLENVHIIKPAYAVEYDYVPAVQLTHTLMTKKLRGLFCAGQINGTSGYEEAAAQGLVAGINAFNYLNNQEMLTLSRSSSYIGTLIDDLVTKDIAEPYRMLTSRSEYRLLLRQDNERFKEKQKKIEEEITRLSKITISPTKEVNETLAQCGESIDKGMKAADLLKRPAITYKILQEASDEIKSAQTGREIYEEAEIQLKYSGYIKRQNQQIEVLDKLEKIKIPDDINYDEMVHISTETREKLAKIRPATLGQASRIGGVKPADLSVLMVLLNR